MQIRLESLPPASAARPGKAVHVDVAPAPVTDLAFAMFRDNGGLVSTGEVVERLRGHWNQPVSRLARWIIAREVLCLEAHDKLWLPLFQFDFAAGLVRPEARYVFSTLAPAFDSGEMVRWFVEPNSGLADESPVRVFMHDPQAVLQAARVDRFVAMG
jgi:hypothetical protein